jgi:prenylcysteine oxidase / farnesylcysteine lyase
MFAGAGAAGSSAGYHLKKFAKSAGVDVNITIFEKSAYVGGRSTTVNAYADPLEPIELGASIFVEVNTILKNATIEFGLNTQPHRPTGDEPELLGIWNGEKFVYVQKEGGWAWWDTAKLLWKYGLAPIRTQHLMQSTVAKFMKLYEPPYFPFRSLSDRALDLGLISITGVTGNQLLTENNVRSPISTTASKH